MHRAGTPRRYPAWLMLAFTVVVAAAARGEAQVSTATIQGRVTDATGVLPGATVTARETQSGFTREAVTGADGVYTLAGLRPGTYELRVTMDLFQPQVRTVQVLVGQSVSADFRMSADLVFTETVQVVSDRLVDTRATQVATNVTQEQLDHLPQNSRNFLNFAALAPGLRISDNDFRKEFSAGALPSQNVNVFIDGVSYKNDVIDGGVVGQDASRGNPFPQAAVQEFQVLTQNFKAEYEKAASAIITAVTKSGGNRYSGELFNFYQDKALVENETIVRDPTGLFVKGKTTPKPAFERWQWGASFGGPIVKDRAQFFATYEENRQDRAGTVIVGSVSNAPAALVEDLRRHEGTFISPFREKLLFTKGSWQPAQGQQVELTYSWRNETDIRGFGGEGGFNSFETAENVRNRVDSVQSKWQIAGSSFLNEAYLSYQRYRWNPEPENEEIVGRNYVGLLRVGGRDTEQLIVQQRTSLRNDYSRFLSWHGNHTAKAGAVLSLLDYNVRKEFTGNPLFTFRGDIGWDFPAEARFGVGDPDLSANNFQLGLFAQDDWAIGRMRLNLGLRWDYESDMLNNDYVTPQNVREATASFVDNQRYFTDGDDRPPFYGMWQPRLGFAYDVAPRTVAFGGFGRYYDRVLYNSTLDERFRLQYAVRTFHFSREGGIRNGNQTIVWQPSFLSREGLNQVIASGLAPNPEVFLIANDTKPPVSDQWSLGVRHTIAGIVTSATYSGVRARNLFTFLFGTRRPDGTCCLPVPGFSNILISDPEGRKTWYDALYVQVDRPYGTRGQRYGFTVTYTLGKAEQTGGDLFSLDFPTVADYPRFPTATDERHRLILTGIAGLPFDFIASTFITLGSGTPYTINDQSRGSGPNERRLLRNEGRPERFSFIFPNAWAYRTVDLQVERAFRFGGTHAVSVIFQGFNIFSFDNFTGYQGFIPTLPAMNINFGRPSGLIDPGRRLQFGARYRF